MNLFQLSSRRVLFGFSLLLIGVVCVILALSISGFNIFELVKHAGTWYAPISGQS